MGCALSFSFNLVIVFYYHRFENFHFQLMRSLPLTLNQRMLNFIFICVLLMLPEIGAIVNYFPPGISKLHLLSVLVFGLSISLLGYCFLFLKDITLESFIQRVFWMALLWIVLILFKIPAVVLAIIHIGISIRVYQKHFYRFEFNAEVNSEK